MAFKMTGHLMNRVTIMKPVDSSENPFDKVAYEPLYVLWASVQPQRGKEYYDSQRITDQLNVKIVIRYKKDIDETMQVACKGHTYVIQSVVDPYLAHESLELYCIEKKRGKKGRLHV